MENHINKNYAETLLMRHALLISKLYANGLWMDVCQLIADYLPNKKQITKLGMKTNICGLI